jgi:hypothetical protein
MATYPKTCIGCGEAFTARHPRAATCSGRCRNRKWRAAEAARKTLADAIIRDYEAALYAMPTNDALNAWRRMNERLGRTEARRRLVAAVSAPGR